MSENQIDGFLHLKTPAYAGFWQRFGSLVIDVLVLSVPLYMLAYLLSNSFDRTLIDQPSPPVNFYHFLRVVICWGYFALFESSRLRATPGKLAFHLIVTGKTGEKLSFYKATVRYFAKVISITFAGLGCFMALFTKTKQAFHDVAVNSVVLKKYKLSGSRVIQPGIG